MKTLVAGKDLMKHHYEIKKKAFYSELYLEGITDKDYTHVHKVSEEFNLKISVNTTIFMFKSIHYHLQMYLKTLETSVLRYINYIVLIFISTRISMALFKKDGIKIRIINRY